MKSAARLRAAALAASLFFCTNSLTAQVIFSCPFSNSGGDLLFRGFYLQSYPGVNLGTVTLGYLSFTPGTYSASLTARLGAYDGPIIGSTETVNFNLTGSITSETLVTYDFGGAPVPFGSIVTFTQTQLTGPSSIFFDVGVGPCPGIFETGGTSPPLDTAFRDSVGIIVTQVPEPTCLALLGSAIIGLICFVARQDGRPGEKPAALPLS